MKSIEIIVPRTLVKKHYPHPEFYGESIVELKNGMDTDIYTNDDGYLFTITSEEDLIKYLKENYEDDQKLLLESNQLKLRSINHHDTDLLFTWFNLQTNYSYNDLGLDKDSVITYISHSRTMFSHLFMISVNEIDLGLIGYTVIDGVAVINLEIYLKDKIQDSEVDEVLRLIMDFVNKNYDVNKFQTIVFSDDEYSNKILVRNEFKFIDDDYEFAVSFEDVRKGNLFENRVQHPTISR